jgi:large subunit ribosomal protein L16
MKGKATRGNYVAYGQFGIQATEPCWITSNQIEAARIAINRRLRRGGKVWIKIFPDKPVTKKPAETRMGKGKGSPEYWVAVIKPGRVLFEIAGVSEAMAREAMRLASHKLPCKTRFIQSERTFTEEELASFAEVHVTEEDLIPASELEEELLTVEESDGGSDDAKEAENDESN